MPLAALPVVDTRSYFRPVASELVALLGTLAPDDWLRPTVAGSWRVRDVVAHLVDTMCRRLSFHRDGLTPPPPPHAIASEQDFVAFINGLNKQWVDAAERLSPRMLTDLFATVSSALADFMEQLPLDAPALFPVSWAGEDRSAGWFDVGREFTELWHHQAQIRLAVGAPPISDARYLHAVIEIAMRGLPHAYRAVDAAEAATLAIVVHGDAGGAWTLKRARGQWTLWAGAEEAPTTIARISDEHAWRLLFNGLPHAQASAALDIAGDHALARPLLKARSVIV
jgi:uncharacterized protein (TIGR03083 family)